MNQQTLRFTKFCIVGGSGVIVNLGLLFVLVEYFYLGENLAWLIAILASILNNFLWNNAFTYNDRRSNSHNETMRRIVYYYLISLGVMLFNFAIYKIGISWGFYYILSAFMGIFFSTFLNFALINKLVWNNSLTKVQIKNRT
ncbi:MAG: GtrA family protein [Patescibacteria group bacterium]|nr:GtrA family protein [Patescibacteria group bacterium]